MRTICDWEKEIIGLPLIRGRGQGVVGKQREAEPELLFCFVLFQAHEISFSLEVAAGFC